MGGRSPQIIGGNHSMSDTTINELIIRAKRGDKLNWFQWRDIRNYVGRFSANPSRIIRFGTSAGAAALLLEAAIIALVKYYENKSTPLTQEEKKFYEDVLAGKASASDVWSKSLANLDSSATSGALSVSGTSPLEGVDVLDWDPTPPPVARPGPVPEIITKVKFEDRKLGISISPTIGPVRQDLWPQQEIDISDARLVDTPAKPIVTTTPAVTDLETNINDVDEEADLVGRLGALDIPQVDIPYNPGITGNLVDVIPVTTFTVKTHAGINLDVSVNPNIEEAVIEGHTPRKDTKPTGLLYLATLRFINRTFGRLTEFDDLQQSITQNMMFAYDTSICVEEGKCIKIQRGQTLGQIPLKYRAAILANLSVTKSIMILDNDSFLRDLVGMELADTAIGLATQGERMLINELGIRGITDYGNITTWVNRIEKLSETFKNEE